MSTSASGDRSLAILRVVVWFLMGMLTLAALLLLFVGIASLVGGEGVLDGLHLGSDPMAIWLFRALLAAGLVAIAMALRFFRELLAIIATVGEGDPFVPGNADRLERMGWISLILVAIGLTMTALAVTLKGMAPNVEVSVEISPGILVMTLVLFVLARVFRHGTELRRDLEGTV